MEEKLSQSDMAELIIEIKLQINRALYESGLISEEVYRVAQEKIVSRNY